jgi:hypothetical protein
MPRSFSQDKHGDYSTMRYIAILGAWVGAYLAVIGGIGWLFIGKTDGITMAGVGTALIGIVVTGKWLQAKVEAQEPTVDVRGPE